MNWLNIKTSLFDCVSCNTGRITTIHDALVMAPRERHNWFFYEDGKKYSDQFNDTSTIDDLRTSLMTDIERIRLKKTLQCWTPSACYTDKSRNPSKQVREHINPVIQFDFDHLEDYDIEEVKASIFSIPFICCVGLSCSGKGLFALGLIEEPEKLYDYAEHCFNVFDSYGLPIDKSKGRHYNDLRFVTYDEKMLFKTSPTPLKINHFNRLKNSDSITPVQSTSKQFKDSQGLVKWAVDQILSAQVGQRFATVQKIAFSMGGHNTGIAEIKEAIQNTQAFKGLESKYIKVAMDCFQAGQLKPIAA